ncbi:MFS transporter [Clostridium felsineum]|uniref:Enterobactin exporter EntS n=1 Tax=Clostridium felsineum TaxID=36839 RepID=A0A1S8LYV0_9CLOT|nr:MFS transporter [Clostridium felsineum]URZ09047.1 Enterobactin exporter EntS [Clostridium felsineum]URZ13734.1 Enterobactin exporter EntS [Clostridium felsineum]
MKKFDLLKNKNFMLLWFAHSVSSLGDQVYSIAIMWYVMLLYKSTIYMGLSLVFTQLPILIFSPFAGVLADKFNRKKILIICDILSAVLIFIIFITSLNSKLNIYTIYAVSFLVSSVGAFFSPSMISLIPTFVEKKDLPLANSMNRVTTSLYGIIGPAFAGVLIALLGVKPLFIMNSLSFLFSALCESFILLPSIINKHTLQEKLNLLIKVKEGFQYCKKIKIVFYFMLIAGCIDNFFSAPLDIYIPIYSSKIFNMGSSGYGLLMALPAVGAILASIIFPFMNKKDNVYLKLTLWVSLEGIFVITLGLSKSLIFAFISLFMLGFSTSMTNINLSLIMQLIVPNEFMGRISSIFSMLASFTIPLGYFFGGLLCSHIMVSSIVFFSGIIMTLAGISTFKLTYKKEFNIAA